MEHVKNKTKEQKTKKSIKYYAVFNGRQIGIFTNWGKTQPIIDRFPHANFKSYTNLRLAVAHMSAAGINNPFLYGECPSDIPYTQISKDEYILNTADILSVIYENDEQNTIEQRDITVQDSQSDYDITFNLQNPSPELENTCVKRILSSHCLVGTYASQSTTDTATTNPIKSSSNFEINSEGTAKIELNSKSVHTQTDDINSADRLDKENSNNFATFVEHSLQKLLDNQNIIIKQQQMYQQQLSNELATIKENVQNLETDNKCLNEFILEMKQSMKESSARDDNLRLDLMKVTAEKNDLVLSLSNLKENCAQLKNIESNLKEKLAQQEEENNILVQRLKQNLTDQKNSGKLENKTLQTKAPSHKDNTGHYPDSIWGPFNVTNEIETDEASTALKLDKTMVDNEIHTSKTAVYESTKKSDSQFSLDSTSDHHSADYKPSPQRLQHEQIIKRNALKLPQQSKNILIGDSNMKNVMRRRLDKSGKTEIRTFRGATVKILTEIFKRSCEYPNVEKVSICIGTNNCSRQSIDGMRLIEDMEHMIDAAKQIFPSASLCILSIPPQKNPEVNKYIWKINKSLKRTAESKGVSYRFCSSLWYHVSSEGVVDKGILVDQVHLTEFGLGLLLQNVTHFFFGPPRLRNHESNSSKEYGSDSHRLINRSPSYTSSVIDIPDDQLNFTKSSKPQKRNTDKPKLFTKLKNTCTGLLKRFIEQ